MLPPCVLLKIKETLNNPTGRDTAVDLALSGASFLSLVGTIPGAISAGKTLHKYLNARDNWTAFLMKLAKFQ
jgi:hypothetical protein